MSAFKTLLHAGFGCLMAGSTGVWAQPAPSINAGGVVNAASSAPGAAVAPGSIVSVYGDFLLTGSFGAQSVPLPDNLGGLSLAFGAAAAPPSMREAGR